jgi:5-methylcytosine-specific restriction enzyme A
MSPYSAKTLKPRGWVDPEKRRPNSAARGYGRQWRNLRQRILAQHPICMKCREAPSDTVDHIITKARGGTDDESNLQAFCRECHSRKTALVDDRWGKGELQEQP